jgi:hypothetical protein
MKHTLTTFLLLLFTTALFSQVPLIIEGQVIVDTETGVSNGYNIPRNQVTALTFRNNKMTSVNSVGYILQAGDERPGLNNNHLDGTVLMRAVGHMLFSQDITWVLLSNTITFSIPRMAFRESQMG